MSGILHVRVCGGAPAGNRWLYLEADQNRRASTEVQ